MGRSVVKNMSKNLSTKYGQKRLIHAKQSAIDALKTTSKRAIQKTAEVAGDLIGKKIVDKITSASKISPKNNSETNEEEILRKNIYISGTKKESYWCSKIKIITIHNNGK